jgi:glycosyltransferase involved in cell wall biosynthesis
VTVLSIIIPLYNEEDIILDMLEKLDSNFRKILGQTEWEFLFIDNGSTDRTPEILNELCEKKNNVKVVHEPIPNYGLALKKGMNNCSSDYAHIINIEQWDMTFFAWAWSLREEYDLFLGSKLADPSTNHQSGYRKFLSWGLNSLLKLYFEFPGADTHGPKLVNMKSIKNILEKCVMGRGQFDTELTIRSLRGGLKIAEAPSEYVEYRQPRNMLIKKIVWNIIAISKMWWILKDLPYESYVRLYRFTRYEQLEIAEKFDVELQKPVFK